jgi:D-alanyl-D-alanine carboxypeptidase
MSARPRALVILGSLMAAMVSVALLLIAGTGTVDSQTARRGIGIAGTTATNLALFRDEVLAWASTRLSTTEVARVRDSSKVAAISAVRTGLLPVTSGRIDYPVIPVEAMSVDPDAYAAAVGPAGGQLAGMLSRGVVLSRTGAGLRQLKKSGHLRLIGGRSFTVSGVVDDQLLGGYEVAMDLAQGRKLGIDRVGYLLLRPRGTRAALETAVRGLLHGSKIGFRHPGQVPWFRAGDGTLPLARIKARFGEFAVGNLARPVPDAAWVRRNIVTRTIPVLGQVRCHRAIVNDLGLAMADVQAEGLQALVDAGAFRRAGGCVPARAGSGGLGHKAWGIALDLAGAGGQVDRRVVAAMARHGFTWGGRWLRPEAAHFEWVGTGA